MKYLFSVFAIFLLLIASCSQETDSGVTNVSIVTSGGSPCTNAYVSVNYTANGCAQSLSGSVNGSGVFTAQVSPPQTVNVTVYAINRDTLITGAFPDTVMTITIDTTNICGTASIDLQSGIVTNSTIIASRCN